MQTPVKVLYEDDCLVVFDKPAGLLVIPTPKNEKHTLVDIVNAGRTAGRLHPCHRLDRETSGAIIFAKGKRNQQLMMEVFHKSAVHKKYIAFVRGKLKRPSGEIRLPIQDAFQKKYHRNAPPRTAVTRYKVIKVKHRFSIVEVTPLTGRTNQIRIHFSQIEHPLLGERVYAYGRDFTLKFRRVALHASEIEWKHPVTHEDILVESPLPADMKDFMNSN
ncbi:MAG: RluA family pseudouridine synthase [Candidatus Omnitrophota bacterium]|nr:RluA family pseudouridine synthase [Candidatus Omnitrophota bacterium]MDZ4242315.1 RluA family pseudouridine synthase [Candidatus Omnitrophota bacterium]